MSKPILVSTVEPGLPFEGLALQDMHGNKVTEVRSPSNHFILIDDQPVLYSENFGSRLWRLAKIPEEAMNECVDLLKELATERQSSQRIEILQINNQPAAKCKLAEVFLRNGFVELGDKLVL